MHIYIYTILEIRTARSDKNTNSCPNSCHATDQVDAIANESVPIQLAQCWFLGLAISSAEI